MDRRFLIIVVVLIGAVLFLRREESEVSPAPNTESVSPEAAFEEVTPTPLDRSSVFPSIESLQESGDASHCNKGDEDAGLSEDDSGALIEKMVPVLIESQDSDHRFAASILLERNDPERYRQQVLQLINANPPHELATAYALDACSRDAVFCSIIPRFVAGEFSALDDNFHSWVDVAGYYLDRGDEQQAVAMLQRAIAAPEVSNHFTDYVQVFDRSLAASSDLDGFDRLIGGIGFAAAIADSQSVYGVCRDRIEASAWWRDLCLQLTERQAMESNTYLDRMIARGIQRRIYEAAGESEKASQLQTEIDTFLEGANANMRANNRAIMERDEALMRAMFDRWVAYDEHVANQFLAAEVERKIASGEYPPQSDCPDP